MENREIIKKKDAGLVKAAKVIKKLKGEKEEVSTKLAEIEEENKTLAEKLNDSKLKLAKLEKEKKAADFVDSLIDKGHIDPIKRDATIEKMVKNDQSVDKVAELFELKGYDPDDMGKLVDGPGSGKQKEAEEKSFDEKVQDKQYDILEQILHEDN